MRAMVSRHDPGLLSPGFFVLIFAWDVDTLAINITLHGFQKVFWQYFRGIGVAHEFLLVLNNNRRIIQRLLQDRHDRAFIPFSDQHPLFVGFVGFFQAYSKSAYVASSAPP